MVALAALGPLPTGGQTLIIAHRGARHAAPENTLVAFRRAIELGANAVEFDVRLTRDGHPVVIHDAGLERTTDGRGRVAQMTLRQLRALDAGSWFSPAFAGQRIPTLEEALELVGEVSLINVDLKPSLGPNLRLARAVERVLSQNRPSGTVLISACNPITLLYLRRLRPELPLAAVVHHVSQPRLHARILRHLVRPAALHATLKAAHGSFIARAHRRGLWVNIWTVNDRQDMRRLIRLGADGIFTDRVDLAFGVVSEQSISWLP